MSNNIKNNSAIDVIKEYLDNRAKQDPQFAESYAKDNKNLKECFSYIMGEARKRATGNSCCMTSDEVFGLAVHYYDEDDIKISRRNGSASVKVGSVKVGNDGSESKADTSKKKEAVKKKETAGTKSVRKQEPQKEIKAVQLELFNWDEL